MSWFSAQQIQQLISTYGYFAIGVIVGLESMGLPLPGETILLLSALYAGTHHDLNIWGVIATAATGAILGDNVGYWLGRQFGYPLLLRFGGYIGLSDNRIKLGQYLFLCHGGKVVFFGRFIAVLRILAAFLAGVNRMDWRGFLVANSTGGILWALTYGLAAYSFGTVVFHAHGPLTIAFLIPAGIDQLYSGETMITPSTARIASANAVTSAGKPDVFWMSAL